MLNEAEVLAEAPIKRLGLDLVCAWKVRQWAIRLQRED